MPNKNTDKEKTNKKDKKLKIEGGDENLTRINGNGYIQLETQCHLSQTESKKVRAERKFGEFSSINGRIASEGVSRLARDRYF